MRYTLEHYREAALAMTGWFTVDELSKATQHLRSKGDSPSHLGRVENAIQQLRAQGLLEVRETRRNYKSQGQAYRVKS